MENNYRYVTMFDNEGFESIIDITCDMFTKTNAILHDEPDPEKNIYSLIHRMTLRATFNPHREPEIWIFWSDLDEKTLYDSAVENPQMMADLIRQKGVNVYRTSLSKRKRVIE